MVARAGGFALTKLDTEAHDCVPVNLSLSHLNTRSFSWGCRSLSLLRTLQYRL
jgi:hypothetical protein